MAAQPAASTNPGGLNSNLFQFKAEFFFLFFFLEALLTLFFCFCLFYQLVLLGESAVGKSVSLISNILGGVDLNRVLYFVL